MGEKNIKKKVLVSIVISTITALIVTGLFIYLYQYLRGILINAIELKSIALLGHFDLLTKIHDKMGFNTIPTIWDMQIHYGMIIKFSVSIVVISQLLYWMPREVWSQHKTTFFPDINLNFNLKKRIGWKIGLIILVMLFYTIFSYFLYLCWMGGDDWYSTMSTGLSLPSRLAWWGWCWMTHVSRIGEMLVYLHPLTLDRWQHYLITPLFWISFPFIIKYMIGKYADFKMYSAKGLIFYATMASMTLLGIKNIMIPTCYIVSANYVYGSILSILYFAIIFHRNKEKTSVLGIITLSFLALICGWSTEGFAVMGLATFVIYLFYLSRKGIYLNKANYISIIFYFIGTCNVLFSPGPIVRGHLNPTITGGNVPYNLSSIGLFDRLAYIPEWIESICSSMYMNFILILIFSCIVLIYKSRFTNGALLWIHITIPVAIGLLSALAYLVGGAIPNASTYIPSCYCLCIAIGILLATLLNQNILITSIISVSIVLFFAISIGQKIAFLAPLKHYESQMYEEIFRQKNLGKEHIVLDYPFDSEIQEKELEYEADKFKCKYFKVKSIKIRPFNKTKNCN